MKVKMQIDNKRHVILDFEYDGARDIYTMVCIPEFIPDFVALLNNHGVKTELIED